MPKLKKWIKVDVPVRVAYDQWIQFEEFPSFMEGVQSVQQLDDKRLHWRAGVGGRVEEWDAEIYQQEPDRVIAWRSISGAPNEGVVRFEPHDGDKTKIELELHWEPKDATERVGDVLGADDLRAPARRGRVARSQGVAVAPHRERLREGRELRSHPQPLRLPAAQLRRARFDAAGHDDPWLLIKSDPSRLPQV